MGETESGSLEDALKRISHGISGAYYAPMLYSSKLPSKDVLHKTKENIADILQSAQAEPSNLRLIETFKKYGEIVELLLDIPEQDMMREQEYVGALQSFGNLFALRLDYISKGYVSKMLEEERELFVSTIEFMSQQKNGARNPSARKLVELADKYGGLLKIYCQSPTTH